MSKRDRTQITHDLAFEIWAQDIDTAYLVRLAGDRVTGYYGIASVLGLHNRITSVAEMSFQTDEHGCDEWEDVRGGDSHNWHLEERFNPDWIVPMVSRHQQDHRSLYITFGIILGFVVLWALVR